MSITIYPEAILLVYCITYGLGIRRFARAVVRRRAVGILDWEQGMRTSRRKAGVWAIGTLTAVALWALCDILLLSLSGQVFMIWLSGIVAIGISGFGYHFSVAKELDRQRPAM